MNSATKEVSDSASSNDEPLSTIKSSLHHTRAKKYADYILQRNKSFKRKANNEALEELKVEKKQLKERLLAKKKRQQSLVVEHKRGQETLENKRKERVRRVEAEKKEKLEVERREEEFLESTAARDLRILRVFHQHPKWCIGLYTIDTCGALLLCNK